MFLFEMDGYIIYMLGKEPFVYVCFSISSSSFSFNVDLFGVIHLCFYGKTYFYNTDILSYIKNHVIISSLFKFLSLIFGLLQRPSNGSSIFFYSRAQWAFRYRTRGVIPLL